MKKAACAVGFLVLAAQLPLWSYDTSPTFYQVVPEAIWAPATGGGTWVTEIQILNLSSTAAYVNATFFYDGGSAGGMYLATTPLAQFQCLRISNLLSLMQTLDSSFTYYGRVGAVGFQASDTNCRIQVQAKTVNGNYGKTFPGLNTFDGNTVVVGRAMVLQDLVRNATYRTSVGAFNNSATATFVVRFRIINGANVQVGSAVDRTLAPLAFISFNPFTAAGAPAGDYENCRLTIDVLSGGSTGPGVMCFGSIANNYTNDTYALMAKISSPLSHETSPTAIKTVPEVIWAAATGGGTWVTEVQITNYGPLTTGIEIYFDSAGAWGGEIQLHPGLEKDHSVRYSNILATIDALDPSAFIYYGRVGALHVLATDQTNYIHVQAKTVNGNFGKTFPGLTYNIEGTSAAQGRPMLIQDLVKNSAYRTSVGAYNTSSNFQYVVRFTIFNGNGVQVGSSFDRTLGPNAFQSFNPFTQAGVTTGDYENCWLYMEVLSGGSAAQGVMCFGSIANNITNDTYALIARMFN